MTSEPSSPAPTEARHGRLARRGAGRTVAKLIAIVAAVGLLSTVSVAAIAINQLRSNLGEGVDIGGEEIAVPALAAIDQPVNILIVGSDSGGGNTVYGDRSGARNDVTILLHISPVRHTAIAVSFPRDLDVAIPACPNPAGGNYPAMGTTKINASLNNGLACTVTTVESVTGLDIQYAGVIEFDGVVAMSDAVGGVEVCVATAIHDSHTNVNLEAGLHTLQGNDAMLFLRSRYGVGDGSDLTRISNQQMFLSSLLRKIKSEGVLTNPLTLYSLAEAATTNMSLSTSLNRVDTMVSIALALKDIDLTQMVFAQYPTASTSTGLVARTADAQVLMDAIANDEAVTVQGTGGGTVAAPDDGTPTEEPSTPATEEPTPSDTAAPPATDDPGSDAVALPSSITGQDAAQTTCTNGQSF